MIQEPESRFDGPVFRHYVVEHDGNEYKCNTLAYASYLAEKFNSKVWSLVLNKYITPRIGRCGYCEKYSKLHFIDGNRGSLPPEDDAFGCDRCGSVYRIIDILMETDAYKP
jgi:predicted nucleic-acid-binding Zn-ribbon protein